MAVVQSVKHWNSDHRMVQVEGSSPGGDTYQNFSAMIFISALLQSVSWILAEFYFNRGLQRLYTGTCIIVQKTINGFLCLLIVFLKSKTYQLILKDVIKLNRNLR